MAVHYFSFLLLDGSQKLVRDRYVGAMRKKKETVMTNRLGAPKIRNEKEST